MKSKTNPSNSIAQHSNAINFHGACIVTESGEEIPITEQMLQKAFNDLISAWQKSRQPKRH